MANIGLCADCNKEQELKANGHCLICDSSSTMKRGAINELELAIEQRKLKATELVNAVYFMVNRITGTQEVEAADRLVKALEDYRNV